MFCPRNSPFFSELALESERPGDWKRQSGQRSQTVCLHHSAETEGLADGLGSCWKDASKVGNPEWIAARGCLSDILELWLPSLPAKAGDQLS